MLKKSKIIKTNQKQPTKFFEKKWVVIGLIFLFSFTLRLVYLHQVKTNPFFDSPVIDAKMYDDHAKEIVNGDWLGKEVFYHAPFYAYFLAVIRIIFGHNYYVPRFLQLFIGSLSCILIYLISKKIFNHRVGVIASLVGSVYGVFIFYEGALLRTSLVTFFNLLAILLLLWAGERADFKRWLIVGLILGLAGITRENILLFVPFILIWIGIIFKEKRIKRKIILYYICLCLPITLVIIPITLRNYYVAKDFVFISSQGGLNFYIGNNPKADETSMLQPGPQWDELRALPLRERGLVKPSEQSKWFFSQAFQFIKEEPAKWIKILLKKFVLFWNAFEIEPNQDINFFKARSSLLRILLWRFGGIICPFGIVGPLALMGIIFCVRQWKKVSLLYLFIFFYMTSVILFHVRSRYRIPMVPFLIIFGAYTVHWFFEKIKSKNYRPLILPLLLLGVLSTLINFNFYNIRDSAHFPTQYFLGQAYQNKGLYEKAANEYKEFIKANPDYVNAYIRLGIVLGMKEKYRESVTILKKAAEISPDNPKIYHNLATVYLKQGRREEAIVQLQKTVALDPNNNEAQNALRSLLKSK